MDIKELYKLLDQKYTRVDWRINLDSFTKEVNDIRSKINNDKKSSSIIDKDFLEKLLFERFNGIASAGQSLTNIRSDERNELLNDNHFLEIIEEMIKFPTKENWSKLKEKWHALTGKNNPLLVNRVIAACTENVSVLPDESSFKKVHQWLKENSDYKNEYIDWFSSNMNLMKYLENKLSQQKIDKSNLRIFVWKIYQYINDSFSMKKQVVKYGPPGTGKTYKAKADAEQLFEIWKIENSYSGEYKHHNKFVQFHPSYSYEDFIEGLRPCPDENNNTILKLQNGVFKEFCKSAGKWEIDIYNLNKEKKINLDVSNLKIEELEKYKEDLQGEYWNFIWNIADEQKLVRDVIPPFYFIIDEINRAELSRVFGELMYCLEYRGIEGCIETQYARLNDDDSAMIKDDSGYKFFVPSNVYLIGTMNTIDRSIESFDFALRRRFSWEEVGPDIEVLRDYLGDLNDEWKSMADNLKTLNVKISDQHLLGKDFQIGHAYLMKLESIKNLKIDNARKSIWENSIKPLLQEYLRGTGKENELIKEFQESFGVS